MMNATHKLQSAYSEVHNQLGILLYKAKRLQEAELAFLRALELHPDFADAYNNLGNLLQETKRLSEAEAAFRHAIELNSDYAEAHNNLGHLLYMTKRLVEAEVVFRYALELKPDFAEAHNNLGNLLKDTKHLPEAEGAFLRAIEFKPDFIVAHINLASLLHVMNRLPEAKVYFLRVLEVKPVQVELHDNLEDLLDKAKRQFEDETIFLRDMESQPGYFESCYSLGRLLQKTRHLPESEAIFQRLVKLKPDFAGIHNNLGYLYLESMHLPEAEAAFRQAIKLKPDYAEAYNNLGNVFQKTKRLSDAEASYFHAIKLKPGNVEAYFNLGILFYEERHLHEAEVAFLKALELKPCFAEAKWNLSLLLLVQGRYAEAWTYYESRYDPNFTGAYTKIPSLAFPQWHGESLVGKSLVIIPEQGLGDCIQFARYASMLKGRGVSHLTFVCDPSLKALIETAEGVDSVITDFVAISPHDYWSFLLSLPLYFGSTLQTLPATLPYLHALPQRLDYWYDRLPKKSFKVGLIWNGNPLNKNDSYRSIPELATLAPLWSVSEVTFIGLQTGQRASEEAQSQISQPILHWGSEIRDFADTAAIVAQLDLVICVDTALAHVAGALGTTCWLLLPAQGSDWRWLIDQTDSPWYPGIIRIFRQTELNNWDKPIRDVVEELKKYIEIMEINAILKQKLSADYADCAD